MRRTQARRISPWGVGAVAALLLAVTAVAALTPAAPWRRAETWEQLASPGRLSAVHASLERDCAACHTPVQGVDTAKCVSCHATNEALLQRQPTAFHAQVRECSPCHAEHLGRERRPSEMDHRALARLGVEQLRRAGHTDPESRAAARRLTTWMRRGEGHGTGERHPEVSAAEATLDCFSCHSTKDRHREMFGRDCASCHRTSTWSLAEFRHPSPRSRDCAQCHQAPPSHYMEHFRMVSQQVARQKSAGVEECFRCHRTTSWNDIPGVGWYKHH